MSLISTSGPGAFLLIMSVAACGGDGEPLGRAPGTRPMPGNATADTGPELERVDSLTLPQPGPRPAAEGSDGPVSRPDPGTGTATLTEVRVARHEDFDRVVFEFADRLPGYRIEYVDGPVRQCGSGRAVDVSGEAFLQVRFSSARAHALEGESTIGSREREPNLPAVRELEIICDFEGYVTWILGLASRSRHTVFVLDDPARLVVDIRHSDG